MALTFSWEQRKLGDLVIDHNAGIYISKEDYGSGTNVIGVGNIYDNDIFDGEIYRLGLVNDDRFLLEENDLIYGESWVKTYSRFASFVCRSIYSECSKKAGTRKYDNNSKNIFTYYSRA